MIKFKILGLGLGLLLLTPTSVLASETIKIDVGFNQVKIKVNDQPFNSNSILYNGSTYVSIRDVSSMLGLAANYYDKNKTAYIGQIGAGEFSKDNHDIDSWDIITPATPSNAPIMEQMNTSISVNLNDILIKVNGSKLESDNILYNGTTYVPLRAVSETMDVPVDYDPEIHTAFIGKTSHQFPSVSQTKPPESSTKEEAPKSGMYSIPAEGDMAGWQQLKGHSYEEKANIYFKKDGSFLQTTLKPIQTEDLNRVIEWTDENGKKRKNKLGDLYKLFGTFSNQYTDDFLLSTFGDLYYDWIESSTINADKLVEQFLKETGQLQ
ncbi:copper amine oxidase N-terminal domain-containing protein [Paenibacillus alba]|uniref:Copper amine oxidase N-terminal domain-containing protein n=1 Tax=Paenibacillus alba TaxID=1197127 RepID=A0ABU6G6U8_9BACL|nr:copper amine oxidase N-terminal domain-containing protein [Paenibacillus alba]MEC0229345.1 copper amine oxidase N-terminal domain-containing protein [Paenibacillus alba]